MTKEETVTKEEIDALADKIEASGKNYHEVIDGCTDYELLRQSAMELLVRAIMKPQGWLESSVRDEIIKRRLKEIKRFNSRY